MILFIGQVGRGMRGREAFQEVDYKLFFGGMAKWVVEVDEVVRLPELVARAFRVATQGRPGPVVVSLPEDMLIEEAEIADAPRVTPVEIWPGRDQMEELRHLIAEAARPLIIIGGSRWNEQARGNLVLWSERFDVPVATSFRRASLFPADHQNYAGDVGIGPESEIGCKGKSCRCARSDMRTHVGNAVFILFVDRHSVASAKTRARISGRGGVGSVVPAYSSNPGNSCSFLPSTRLNVRDAYSVRSRGSGTC